ncbi:nucleotide sugar dehydrogenase [Hydrogenobacter thermophilus]|uniref:nucleotide sugar dehydrogenase n=1 Tax=Hydrogenobacter thermophilus TaxID=940 RepID=UPI0030F67361
MLEYSSLLEGREKICVVGMGYVGLPLAVAFSKHFKVIGYDRKASRIKQLISGLDITGELRKEEILNSGVEFTDDERRISEAKFIIVAVPTPVDKLKNPDLSFLKDASTTVGRYLRKDSVVVYESTVYPGATEEVCVPILERESGLKWRRDFFVGYSPERVNPGDREHTVENIVKVVAGDTENTLELVASVYGKIIKAGIYKAPDIRTAEAAKVIENIQRDINIALMNELSMIFHKLDIDTKEVLKAAGTKWNFLKFEPGLVGGHCIPVDPYYLAHKSLQVGHVPELILAGRRINESVPSYIAYQTVKLLIKGGKSINSAKVLLMGITFKENVPDIRNSKVYELYRELEDFGVKVYVYDPVANDEEVRQEYGIDLLKDIKAHKPYDCVILAVKHDTFLESYDLSFYKSVMTKPYILVDVKGIYDRNTAFKEGFIYWRL